MRGPQAAVPGVGRLTLQRIERRLGSDGLGTQAGAQHGRPVAGEVAEER